MWPTGWRCVVGFVIGLATVQAVCLPCSATPIYEPLTTGTGWTRTSYRGIPFAFGDVARAYRPPSGAAVQTDSYTLATPSRAQTIHLLTSMGWATWVSQGTQVGTIRAVYGDGTATTVPMIAGITVSEWAWDRPGLSVSHARAEVGYSWLTRTDSWATYEGHYYYSSFTTDPAKTIQRLELRMESSIFNAGYWLGLHVNAATLDSGPGAVPEIDANGFTTAAGAVIATLGWWERRRRPGPQTVSAAVDRPRAPPSPRRGT